LSALYWYVVIVLIVGEEELICDRLVFVLVDETGGELVLWRHCIAFFSWGLYNVPLLLLFSLTLFFSICTAIV